MPTINDYKKKALNDAGYSDDISTAEWKWLKDICYPYVGAIPDMWRYALRQMGFSGSLIDAQSAMLKDLGYTDFSMNDKWYKYWRDTPLEGTTWWKVGSALDLDFANSRGFNSADRDKTTPDSILTYTNPWPKMVYGNDGVLRYAPHNLLRRSQEFDNALWTYSRTSVQSDAAVAPDGTTTADRLVEDTTSGDHYALQSLTYISQVYTVSAYIKGGAGRNWALLAEGSTGSRRVAYFDIANGAVGATSAGITSSITSVGNGWYRCSMTFTAGASASYFFVALASANNLNAYLGDGASGIYVWGAQASYGTNALTYIPTTSAAKYSLPIDHNPTTFEPLGVLIEEERKNLLLRSQEFNDAAWVKSRATVTANAVTAPDGTTTADKLVPSVDVGTHRVYQLGITHGVLRTYAYTCYLKAGEYTFARLAITDATESDNASCRFNLSDGTLDGSAVASGTFSAASASVVAVGNGWYRCTLIATCDATEATVVTWVASGNTTAGATSFAGDATSGIYLWGAQLEAGAFATSYIPTTNNPLGVTRLADQVSILTSAFAYNAAAGTMVAEVRAANLSVSRRIAVLYNDASNRIALNLDNGSQLFVRTLGSTVASVDGGTFTVGQSDKVAVAFTTDDYVATVNGAAVGVDPDGGAMPSGITVLQVGNQAGIEQTNGHIKRLTYFPTRKTDAELQALAA